MTVDTVGVADASRAALEAAAGGSSVACVLVTGGPRHAGARLLVWEDGQVQGVLEPGLAEVGVALAREVLRQGGTRFETVQADGAFTLFVEAHRAPEPLLIVGAGHIAVPLARLGVALGFRVTVLDDREAFATAERFPADARVLRADFETDPFAGVAIDARTSVALVTRGHRWDFDCLRRLVATEPLPRYVGMIGSRRRVRAAFRALLEAGLPREVLGLVRAPIGIEIGAETPEEIAVSIAAELVAARRGVDVESLTSRERVLERLLPGEDTGDG
jgi:xanthine dehydrogenase accessory factor